MYIESLDHIKLEETRMYKHIWIKKRNQIQKEIDAQLHSNTYMKEQ